MNINISNRNSSKPDGYNFFTQTIIMTLTLMVVGLILPGVHITNVFVAIFAAVVIAMLNNFLRPVLLLLTLPFTIVTMGLFIFVVNAIIIWLAAKIVPSFSIDGFGTAFFAALLITIINYLLEIPARWRSRGEYRNNDENDGFAEYEEVTDENKD